MDKNLYLDQDEFKSVMFETAMLDLAAEIERLNQELTIINEKIRLLGVEENAE